MKIVCATLNSKYIHSSLAPWCLKAGADAFCKENYDITIVEGTVNEDIETVFNRIIAEKPGMIAFSVYIWNITYTLNLAKLIKESIDIPVILGGPEVAYRRKEILSEYKFIDFVISGEGEWSFSSFLNEYSSSQEFFLCEGLCFRNKDDIIENEEVLHYETPPSPYCDEYYENLRGRLAYFESSRGCPFSCAFCLSGRTNALRYFDYDKTVAQLIKIANSGTKTVKFIDRTFNADYNKCNALIDFIRNNYGKSIPEGICFHFEFDANIIHDSTIEILKSMPFGAVQLEIGIQSFNKDTLKSIGRSDNTDKLISNLHKITELENIHIHLDLIAGLPFEGLNEFKNSFNIAFLLRPDMLQCGFLKLLYGAKMRAFPEKFPCKHCNLPPYEVISTPYLSEYDMKIIKHCEKALDKLYNSGRFLFTINYLLDNYFNDAFELFCFIGKSDVFADNSLTNIIGRLYNLLSEICDKNELREIILCDIASTNVNIKIPGQLVKYNKDYKRLKKKYTELYKTKVNIVILENRNKTFIALNNGKTDKNKRLYNFIISEE